MKDRKNKIIYDKDNHDSYRKLLSDKRWKKRREDILKRDNYKCTVCSSKEYLQVHHKQYHFHNLTRTYKKPWNYPDYLLVTFCRTCHDNGHKRFRIPLKHI